MHDHIIVVGAGGLGREVRSMLPDLNFEFAGFADDDPQKPGVLAAVDELYEKTDIRNLALGIGSSGLRQKLYQKLQQGFNFPNLLHPQAILQDKDSITFGTGNIITVGNILTCDIRLGNFCLVNLNCTIGHDVVMEDFCSLMPSVNLSGQVYLEEGAFIGTGATVLPGIRIGKNTVIGAGAVVTKDIPPDCTAFGIPARPARFHTG